MTATEPVCAHPPRPPAPPETLQACLERAVADGRALLEGEAPVGFDARVNHAPESAERPRTVGASGAVMAVSLGVEAGQGARASDFPAHWDACLRAVERMNTHEWAGAWWKLYGAAGTAQCPHPGAVFNGRMNSAVRTPSREILDFATPDAYRRWLDHVEGDVLETLGAIEGALAADIAPVRAPPAPRTLAEALGVALADGRALAGQDRDGDARYTFNSGVWHDGEGCATCMVCAAGAVMARTLGSPPQRTIYPESFAHAWTCALQAIDALRAEHWRTAFNHTHGERHPGGARFAQAMHDDARTGGLDGGVFADRAHYQAWLGYVEADMLPAITAHEAEAL